LTGPDVAPYRRRGASAGHRITAPARGNYDSPGRRTWLASLIIGWLACSVVAYVWITRFGVENDTMPD
jgi:hypothetical protein